MVSWSVLAPGSTGHRPRVGSEIRLLSIVHDEPSHGGLISWRLMARSCFYRGKLVLSSWLGSNVSITAIERQRETETHLGTGCCFHQCNHFPFSLMLARCIQVCIDLIPACYYIYEEMLWCTVYC